MNQLKYTKNKAKQDWVFEVKFNISFDFDLMKL